MRASMRPGHFCPGNPILRRFPTCPDELSFNEAGAFLPRKPWLTGGLGPA